MPTLTPEGRMAYTRKTLNVKIPKGIAEGHFGLDGIRSRVTRLGGTFEIDSRPGEGTKATVTIRMKWERTGEEFNA